MSSLRFLSRLVFSYLLLPAFAGVASADTTLALTPHTAEYNIKISVLGGKLQTSLSAIDGGYVAESSIRATGISRIFARGEIRESSRFAYFANGLRPSHFVSNDGLTRDKETIDFRFDWEAGLIIGLMNGEPFEAGIDGPVHDRVSLRYGLMHDLSSDIHRSDYFLQDAEKFKPLSVMNIGSKTVQVPFGSFEAIGVQHQAEGSSRVTTLWCVDELGFLPVIIEQHRKGKLQFQAELTHYTPITGEEVPKSR
ncbi:MAG: DUF3108 domain-containing protein [Woeseiaceae bacterium]|nr:DUF3108 domain-containing protein [Woeseiaceae bacterium]